MIPQARITLIGLGQVGTSLGLALQRVKTNFQIVGHDKDAAQGRRARKLGAVDRTDWNLLNAVEGAGLVILAIPALEVRRTLEHIAGQVASGTILTDTCSTKARVLDWAGQLVPPQVNFVGGHPILAPAAEPSADLLQGAQYVLIPRPDSDGQALEFMSQLVASLGAVPYYLDAPEHDALMAAVAHLPMALSALLLRTVAHSGSWEDFHRLGGAGEFLARLAPGSHTEQHGAVETNRPAVLAWLKRLQAEMERLQAVLEAEDEAALEQLFQEAFQARARWQAGPRAAQDSQPDLGWTRWIGLAGRRPDRPRGRGPTSPGDPPPTASPGRPPGPKGPRGGDHQP